MQEILLVSFQCSLIQIIKLSNRVGVKIIVPNDASSAILEPMFLAEVREKLMTGEPKKRLKERSRNIETRLSRCPKNITFDE